MWKNLPLFLPALGIMKPGSARVAFGLTREDRLKPVLERNVGEPLTKTAQRYDIFDFTSPSYLVELKCRSDAYTPDSFRTWLMPVCKGREASTSQKLTRFFYYFNSTNELFTLDYDKELFDTFTREVPEWHPDHQEHYYIPRDCWTKINHAS